MMTEDRLNEMLGRFAGRKIGVIGDFFLDKYFEVDPSLAEISLETGKTAHQVVRVRHSPGAAGSIVNNLVSLGAQEVVTIGFTGDDGGGCELRQDLGNLGCRTEHLLRVPERMTPVYLKPCDITTSGLDGEHERLDTKNRIPLPGHVEDRLVESLSAVLPELDALIIADQVEEEECGVVTSRVRKAIQAESAKRPDLVFWVDSRRRIGEFVNCILKPNQSEAVNAVFPGEGDGFGFDKAIEAGRVLSERSGRPLFMTASERGIIVFHDGRYEEVPGVRVEGPIDPTGAGDSATAGAVLSLASGAQLAEAALIANLVASITVCQIGTTGTARPTELSGRLDMWHRAWGDQ